MEKKWEEMSADEKQEAQFQTLLSPKDHEGSNLQFKSQEVEASYKASITRIKDAVQLKKTPDRVPVALLPNMFPFIDAGMTIEEAIIGKAGSATILESILVPPEQRIGGA